MNLRAELVDRAIFYDPKTNTYYVHYNLTDTHTTTGFPSLEDARAFRDKVYEEKMRLKLVKMHEMAYKKEKELIFKEMVFPYNLLEDARIKLEDISEQMVEDVPDMIQELTPREEECLTKRYLDHMTLEEIAQDYNLTRERVRQIICKALARIRHKLLRKEKEQLINFQKEEIEKSIKNQEETLAKQRQELIDEFKRTGVFDEKMEIAFGKPRIAAPGSLSGLDLEELELSVRSYNCLRRAGITTVTELLKLRYPQDYMRIRNLGKKSMLEIVDNLRKKGFDVEEYERRRNRNID